MKISCYISAFNIEKGQFDYERCLHTCSNYFDEVVVATIANNQDNTQNILEREARILKNIRVIRTDLESDTFLLDGQLKNAALQKCIHDVCVQMDLDETPYGEYGGWRNCGRILLNSDVDCLLVPVLNLYKDVDTYTDINFKFRLHRKYSVHPDFFGKKLRRGPVYLAKLEGGGVDPSLSDTTELVLPDDTLARAAQFTPPELKIFKAGYPTVIHWGHVDLERRAKLNRDFWKATWDGYSGQPQNVGVTISELDGKECFRHGLEL